VVQARHLLRTDPQVYNALSNHLTALFAQTRFNAYVAGRVGTEVPRGELLDRFEAEFGAGSDQYLSLQCDKVQGTSPLTELHITMKQDIDAADSFGELFPDRDVRPQGSCPQRFRIDAVGLGDYLSLAITAATIGAIRAKSASPRRIRSACTRDGSM